MDKISTTKYFQHHCKVTIRRRVTEKTPQTRVVILADTTKFEFGLMSSDSRTSSGGGSEEKGLILIDELLTGTPDWPDSSRYWPLEEYAH